MNSFVTELQQQFIEHKNATRALQMEVYMKNNFPFLGISAPIRRSITKGWVSGINKSCTPKEKWEIIFELWNLDAREYQCAAIDLLTKFKKNEWQIHDLHSFEILLTSKSWWDSVDAIGSNALSDFMAIFSEHQHEIVSGWIYSNNIWLQRCCLIFQLKYGDKIDFELLKSSILQLKHIKEFFIQKAIGWSLRQHSKQDKNAVKEFVTTIELSNLAKREASKYLT